MKKKEENEKSEGDWLSCSRWDIAGNYGRSSVYRLSSFESREAVKPERQMLKIRKSFEGAKRNAGASAL